MKKSLNAKGVPIRWKMHYFYLQKQKELGVNVIRLAHYPQNEYIIRQAEKMGILLLGRNPHLARH